MAPKVHKIVCAGCGIEKDRVLEFTPKQIRTTKRCTTCTSDASSASGATRKKSDKVCQQCGAVRFEPDFAKDQWQRSTATCLECTAGNSRIAVAQSRSRADDFALGPRDKICDHCGAALYNGESSVFCCAHGKHYVDFTQYFKNPANALLNMFKLAWPWRNKDGKKEQSRTTGETIMDGFSNASRRYNNLFCLAVHEVQSADTTKEIKFHSPITPANIRIHGTMYKRVLSCSESNPVRYLVIDPAERLATASALKLDKDLVRKLELLVCTRNPLMESVKR